MRIPLHAATPQQEFVVSLSHQLDGLQPLLHEGFRHLSLMIDVELVDA